jgi:hypothetical protein
MCWRRLSKGRRSASKLQQIAPPPPSAHWHSNAEAGPPSGRLRTQRLASRHRPASRMPALLRAAGGAPVSALWRRQTKAVAIRPPDTLRLGCRLACHPSAPGPLLSRANGATAASGSPQLPHRARPSAPAPPDSSLCAAPRSVRPASTAPQLPSASQAACSRLRPSAPRRGPCGRPEGEGQSGWPHHTGNQHAGSNASGATHTLCNPQYWCHLRRPLRQQLP